MIKNQSEESYNPGEYVGLVYSDRMRTKEDKMNVFTLYDKIFGEQYPSYRSIGRYSITKTTLNVGKASISRNLDGDYVSFSHFRTWRRD